MSWFTRFFEWLFGVEDEPELVYIKDQLAKRKKFAEGYGASKSRSESTDSASSDSGMLSSILAYPDESWPRPPMVHEEAKPITPEAPASQETAPYSGPAESYDSPSSYGSGSSYDSGGSTDSGGGGCDC